MFKFSTPMGGYEIWRFDTENYSVVALACDEDMHPSDSFTDERDIEIATSGNLHDWFCAVVEVRAGDQERVIGRDILGGCSYASFADFTAPRRDYFRDMVRKAVAEARDTLAQQIAA
jgi:hypothetical protein